MAGKNNIIQSRQPSTKHAFNEKSRKSWKRGEFRKISSGGFVVAFLLFCMLTAWFFLPGFRGLIQGDTAIFDEMIPLQPQETVPSPTPEPFESAVNEQRVETPVETEEIFEPTPSPTPKPKYIATENSYISDSVEISIETIAENEKTYYVADIRIKNMDDIATGVFRVPDGITKGDVVETAIQNNAILAINTDYYTYRDSGYIIRDGVVKVNSGWGDTLCIFEDGRMDSFAAGVHDAYELKEMGVVESFTFGPLMVKDGEIIEEYLTGSGLKEAKHPRTGVGYYEPGHYLFVVVDGRKEGYSEGMSIPEFAQLFYERGCQLAYNMDGGGSATMAFMGELTNRPEGKTTHLRNVDGILFIKDDVYESPEVEE